MDRIGEVKRSFLNNLWSVHNIIEPYVIFSKPSVVKENWEKEVNDDYIIWNSNGDFQNFHTHTNSYSSALEIVDSIQKGVLLNDKWLYGITLTLRILDLYNPLMKKYVEYIIDNNIPIKPIEKKWKHFENLNSIIDFHTWHPCPKCKNVYYDLVPEIDGYECKKCGNVYYK